MRMVHIGLSTDINVRIGIGTNTPRAKLRCHGDLHVSGISTFKDRVFFDNDIVISGSAEYTGVYNLISIRFNRY